MAYNPEANGKIERGHGPIVKALAKACKGRVSDSVTDEQFEAKEMGTLMR